MTKHEKMAQLRLKAEQALQRRLYGLKSGKDHDPSPEVVPPEFHSEKSEYQIKSSESVINGSQAELQKFKDLFYHAPVLYITTNAAGEIVEMNKKAEDFISNTIKADEVTSIFKYIDENSSDEFKKKLAEAFETKLHVAGLAMFIDVDNNSFQVKYQLSSYTEPATSRDLCRIIITDIANEKESFENELRVKEHAYNRLATNISEGLLQTELGLLKSINPPFAKMFGYKENELINKPIWELVTDCYSKLLKNILQQTEMVKIKPSYDIKCVRKDGSEFWAELKIKHCCEGGRAFGTLSDITVRKQTEKRLKDSERRLKMSNAAKDKFFSIIAHDLKTPFNTLTGYTYLLMKEYKQYDEEKREAIIKSLYENTKNTFNLLENILVWSRSQTGNINFSPRVINISKLIEENIRLYNPTAKSKNISLSAPSSLPEILVVADPEMIQTVLRNLISNAIKFTPEDGNVMLGVTESEDNKICVYVSDDGLGVSMENQDKLFRIDKNITTKGTNNEIGTGLGLILCKEFIDKNNGEIWMDSSPDEGSTFYFTLNKQTE